MQWWCLRDAGGLETLVDAVDYGMLKKNSHFKVMRIIFK